MLVVSHAAVPELRLRQQADNDNNNNNETQTEHLNRRRSIKASTHGEMWTVSPLTHTQVITGCCDCTVHAGYLSQRARVSTEQWTQWGRKAALVSFINRAEQVLTCQRSQHSKPFYALYVAKYSSFSRSCFRFILAFDLLQLGTFYFQPMLVGW